MLIKQKTGNLSSFDIKDRSIDVLAIDWFETGKRILHKKTASGKEVVLKFLNEAQNLTDGDILWVDETFVVVVEIQPCEAIVIHPRSMIEMAAVCYEIGNKHLPLFYENGSLLIPYDEPLLKVLTAAGYEPKIQHWKLVDPFKTTVSPHGNTDNRQSLFSKILRATSSS